MKLRVDQWDIGHLHTHLQAAADLEAWTIPYYMAAMFSIRERSSPAYQLIQSVVNQEMLHLQLVANVANAYGLSPVFGPKTRSASSSARSAVRRSRRHTTPRIRPSTPRRTASASRS